ncbi:MoaD/ThiS family protein [Streptomyces sp. MBT42]|uniref:MoaD/ThiS family protein n=1 Tax=Streptomyces sp. MBT42 TaxID=1488373 RepID=UPI001E463C79|nr:MoaD/ThiS family protein [Streptomyces sp. MBT42]MCD2463189.1 MoaD/ThiS family protein [Streptomyces sp. MBT42]
MSSTTPAGTIRYRAAAKAEAGTPEEPCRAGTLAEGAGTGPRDRRTDRPRFARLLGHCAFLVDGHPVGDRGHSAVSPDHGGTVDVLPPSPAAETTPYPCPRTSAP